MLARATALLFCNAYYKCRHYSALSRLHLPGKDRKTAKFRHMWLHKGTRARSACRKIGLLNPDLRIFLPRLLTNTTTASLLRTKVALTARPHKTLNGVMRQFDLVQLHRRGTTLRKANFENNGRAPNQVFRGLFNNYIYAVFSVKALRIPSSSKKKPREEHWNVMTKARRVSGMPLFQRILLAA